MRNKGSKRHLDDEFMGFEDDERYEELSDSPYYDSVDSDDISYLDNGYISSLFDSYDDEDEEGEYQDDETEIVDDEYEDEIDDEDYDLDLANPVCPNCGAKLNPVDDEDGVCPECGGVGDDCVCEDECGCGEDDIDECMESIDESLLTEAEIYENHRAEASEENDLGSFDVWSNVVENLVFNMMVSSGMDKKEALKKADALVKKNEPNLKDSFESGDSPDEAASAVFG